MSTTTIKTNLNSSSNGCTLAALKKHITTCLQRWRQKRSSKSQDQYRNKAANQKENCYCQFTKNSSKKFFKQSSQEYCFVQRTTIYCKSFNTKLQKLIAPRQSIPKNNSTTVNDSEGPRQYGRKVEIVAKLLSSTLIARRSSATTEESERFCEKQTEVVQSFNTNTKSEFCEDKMTVTDLTFMELREEYPDLNSEIRSILTARAQEGATISEIRDDYRKLTGLTFPIYEDVTEFLLTIPHVTAYCTEKGTRIFNIRPLDRTKHIHDMVMHQKPPVEVPQRSTTSKYCYYRERLRNNNYRPQNWRQAAVSRLTPTNANLDIPPINIREAEQSEQPIPSNDSNLSRNASEGFFANNCFYQDNCNYLLSRICQQQQQQQQQRQHDLQPYQDNERTQQIVAKPASDIGTETVTPLNDLNGDIPSYKNNIHHLNNLFQLQNQQKHHLNNMKTIDTRHSSMNPYRVAMPTSSRSSSPTTKSWYTNESGYIDSDYDAHLLDFLLLGDDFFLYMARMELRCKFKKNQRVLQSGLCVSGQTIGAAIKRIRALSDQRRSIILNIGSVDIMKGRQLIQIEHDFRELIVTMLKKGIKPILTTLAPLANCSHNNEVKHMLERFNDFIKREGHKRKLVVIDVWKCLVNEKGHIFFDCYQNEPRNVTGTMEPYLFWNKIGRQRVLQLIESKLEY